MPQFSLPRNERLRSLKSIRRLFGEGEGGFVYPFRYVFYLEPATSPEVAGQDSFGQGGVEVMFSVPKKFHKRANRRNLLKRRTREAFRLNREELMMQLKQRGVEMDLAFIYSTKEVKEYKNIEYAVKRILEQVLSRL